LSDSPEELERTLGYAFRRRELLLRALSHPSHGHESGSGEDYERLEFLGDAVLGFLLAERIYRRRPELDQGGMTRLRARLVNTRSLAARARELDLGAHLRLGRGEEGSGGRRKKSLLADAFEALVAAVFIDGGIRPVRSLVRRIFGAELERANVDASTDDPKTRLQELLQSRGRSRPSYRVGAVSGPAHQRSFLVELLVEGRVSARAEAGSKKAAERQAAARAIEDLLAGALSEEE
jgi:ribonuclease-3